MRNKYGPLKLLDDLKVPVQAHKIQIVLLPTYMYVARINGACLLYIMHYCGGHYYLE